MTREQTSGILAILTAQQWSFERDIQDPGALLAGFHMALKDLEIAQVESAIEQWIQTQRRFPAAAEIRVLAAPLAKQQLDSALYGRYADLRRRLQRGELDAAAERELAQVEHRLGIAHLSTRPASTRLAVAS